MKIFNKYKDYKVYLTDKVESSLAKRINSLIIELMKNRVLINPFHNSPQWATYLNNYKNIKTYYTFFFKKNQIVGYNIILKQRKFGINFFMWLSPFLWLAPLLNDEEKLIFFELLFSVFKKQKIFLLKNAIFHNNIFINRLIFMKREISAGTFVIDLNKNLDDIFKSFKSSLRKNLNKICSQNLTVNILGSKREDFIFYDKLLTYYKTSKNLPLPFMHPYVNFYDFLIEHKSFLEFIDFKIFCIYQNDSLLAFMSVLRFYDYIIEKGLFITDYAKKNGLVAGDMLKWEVIKYFKSRGAKYYDLAGVILSNDKKTQNIYRYKKKWGGIFIPYKYISGFIKFKL